MHLSLAINEVIVLEDFAVADVDLLDVLAVYASQFEKYSTHCLLFVTHPEGIRDVCHCELLDSSQLVPLSLLVKLESQGGGTIDRGRVSSRSPQRFGRGLVLDAPLVFYLRALHVILRIVV